jgi:hypothetical protein
LGSITPPNQSMKPSGPFRNKLSLFATTPCRGLAPSRYMVNLSVRCEMKKTFVLFLLAFAASVCAAQIDLPPVYTVVVNSHRCLVLEPDHLPQNAPLVVLLHEAHGSARSLVYLWSELHLPPARVACPDGLFFLEGKGFGWYHKERQSDIVQSRDYLLKLVPAARPEKAGDLRWSFSRRGHVNRNGTSLSE